MTANAQIEDEIFAHRANVARCQRNLEAHLAPEERDFIERWLSEEQEALTRLTGVGSR
jgi:hypothetical protein